MRLMHYTGRIPNKLTAEADAHLGPGGPANAKKGTLDVHRGGGSPRQYTREHTHILPDTYQFGYFLRNTDPHVLVVKVSLVSCALPHRVSSM